MSPRARSPSGSAATSASNGRTAYETDQASSPIVNGRAEGVAAAQEVVGNEDLGGVADELLSAPCRKEIAERAASRMDALKVTDGFGEVLVVALGDPSIDLSVRLAEHSGERLGGHSFGGRVRCDHYV